MKKKIVLAFVLAALTVLVLALTIGASDVYSDYTQPGANGEKPIFTLIGYAIDPNEKSICVEYSIDLDALEAYEKATGEKIKYGIVIAYAGYVEDSMPLDNETAKPKGENKDMIFIHSVNKRTPLLSVRIVGLTEAQFREQFVMSLYTFDKNGVKYISDDKSTDTVKDYTYSEVRGPIQVKINGMTYATETETTLSYDRLRQMAESKAGYNTTTMSDSDAKSIIDKSNLVITGGSLIGWSNAAKLLQHFLDGSGEQYTLNMSSFLSDSTIKGFRDSDINNALRAAEAIAIVGESLDVNQKSENLHRPSGDWYYAVGSYFTDVDVLNLTVTVDANGVKTYNADIRYIATDFYNWNKNDTTPVIDKKVLFFSITGPSPAELYRLHESGRAQEFLTYGEITYSNVTWTEGQDVSAIAGLK